VDPWSSLGFDPRPALRHSVTRLAAHMTENSAERELANQVRWLD
jgi:hypothetical protein